MAKLTYFNGRGLAEIIRMTMTVGDIQYTEVDMKTREEFLATVAELPYQQLPLLEIDGLRLVQCRAIVRYLARKAHLYGSSAAEETQIDMLYEATRDFLYPSFVTMGFVPEEKAKEDIKAKTFPRYLPAFEKALSGSKSGFLVGSKLSVADLGLMECILATVDYFGEEQLREHPNIKRFYETMKSNPKVAKYIKDVRKPKNDEAYVQSIKVILSHLVS